jgi:hypothetical protein
MVTSESNRGQPATATPPFERQTQVFAAPVPPFEPQAQAFPASPAAPAQQSQAQAEQRGAVSLRDPLLSISMVVAGATIGSMWALGALVLAILGLSAVTPIYMLPVAAIALGAAFLILSAIGRVWASMFPFAEDDTSRDRKLFSSGSLAVMIAGLAGIALGILNLMYLTGVRFGAVTVIVLGLGLLWHSRVMRRVSRFPYHGVEGRQLKGPLAINALTLAPLRDFLVGLVSVILGVLAILNIAPLTLAFVALLAVSPAVVFTTSTICSATLATFQGACSKNRG